LIPDKKFVTSCTEEHSPDKNQKSCENAYCAQTMLRHRSHPLAHSSNINDEKRDVYTTRKKYHPYN